MKYYKYPDKLPVENGMYVIVCRNDYGNGPENVHVLNSWHDDKWDVDYANIIAFSKRINKYQQMKPILRHCCTARHRCNVLLEAKKILDKNPCSVFRRLVADLASIYCAVLSSLDGGNKT